MKKALVTGCTGQDGSYLIELLLSKGYLVYGLLPQRATFNTKNIKHILKDVHFITADLCDQSSINQALFSIRPDEVYNLGAQSFVKASWDLPDYTSNINGLGVLRMLEGIRQFCPQAKFYQASTSEMFGKVQKTPQNEMTPFYPRSPYGVAKLYGHWITINYRESYSMFNCSGILFNHDSPRRGEQFVTQKIAKAAALISHGLQDKLILGNIDAKRDIGHAKDYVNAMWLMLQQNKPDDYVISSGQTHSVKDILDIAFQKVGLDWTQYVEQNAEFMRPAEVDILQGDSTKANSILGWIPKYSFKDIIEEMVDFQLALIK
jgi:GDPmannose 4,6-dehydratase